MAKFKKYLITSSLVLTVIFGLEQLSFENNVFADTRGHCCNANPSQCNDESCSSTSTIDYITPVKPFCTGDYTLTCKDCIDATAAGELCPPAPSTAWCDDNGDCYGWCDGEWVLDK